MWMRYKHKFAWGIEKTWSYYNVGKYHDDKEQLKSILEELSNEYYYSDKYRGIDYEIIECPPREYLENSIKRLKGYIKSYNKTIKRHEKLIKDNFGPIAKENEDE